MSENFHFEDRAGVKVLVYHDNGCRPATEVESIQDATIAALREEVERLNKALSDTEHIRQYWMGEHGKRVDTIALLRAELAEWKRIAEDNSELMQIWRDAHIEKESR